MSILQNSQKKCYQIKNLKLLSFAKFCCASNYIFSQIPVIKVEISTGETDIIFEKEVVQC